MIGDLDGEYKHDSRRNVLEWCLPVIDANNKTGSLEFSVAGQPNDFFPINVSFVSKRNYCDIQVGGGTPNARSPASVAPSSGHTRGYTLISVVQQRPQWPLAQTTRIFNKPRLI